MIEKYLQTMKELNEKIDNLTSSWRLFKQQSANSVENRFKLLDARYVVHFGLSCMSNRTIVCL